jgi:hypothetical protein
MSSLGNGRREHKLQKLLKTPPTRLAEQPDKKGEASKPWERFSNPSLGESEGKVDTSR